MQVEIGTRYRHKKAGTDYVVLHLGILQINDPQWDMDPVVVYQGDDSRVWVRSVVEFEDRFEELT